ncbi:MAG: ABC transporter ATP-binding protein [Lachnospiraceae bacterium]|nr:ABC transporter ATP-binding protein [Lachnospiraceae bacterium]
MITLVDIYKSFQEQEVLSNLSLQISENEFVAVQGASGKGKTTLLNVMSLLTKPDRGTVMIGNIVSPNPKEVCMLRRFTIGYIFQNYALMQAETVLENLEMSKAYSLHWSLDFVKESLDLVDLKETILSKKIYELSGGEQQRVAIARIILKPSKIIFADEPTGNLDAASAQKVLQIFRHLGKNGKTIVCATHDSNIAGAADRVIELR